MSRVLESITHTLTVNKEYEKAIAFLDAHQKLLSVFDGGCPDFYAAYKAFACENKARVYMKMGDKEKCLAELKRFFTLAEQVRSVSQNTDFNIAVRNPVYFSSISEEILEAYMLDIHPEKVLAKFDAFFGEDASYLQLKKTVTE